MIWCNNKVDSRIKTWIGFTDAIPKGHIISPALNLGEIPLHPVQIEVNIL